MTPYPLLFRPILKPKVWGGRALASLGKDLPPGQSIGESWELADLPEGIEGGRSVIANGELAGKTLRQAIADHRAEIMGDARTTAEGGFPLLIKYLDARENLSVQVHPDHAYVQKHPEAHLKSEAWVIIQAHPGSVIYKGVKPRVTAGQFADDIRKGSVVDDLIAVPAIAGECHYLPSGTCHALGAGIVVAEIQTPSDTTFRVYDWDRPAVSPAASAARSPALTAARELHIEQALECIHFGQPDKPHKPKSPIEVRGVRTTQLVESEYFEIERVDAITMARFPIVNSGLPEVWMLISGSGRIENQGRPLVDLQAGATVLMPAGFDHGLAVLARSACMLRVKLPSPIKGLMA